MPDQLDPSRRASSFFSFLKACAIVGIFSYHSYAETYLPVTFGINSEEILNKGLLNYFISNGLASNLFSAVLQAVFSFGFIGVQLFIIASGFGIYYSYSIKRPTWGAFFRRRLLRLLPLYYLFLLVSFVTYAYFFKDPLFLSPQGLKSLFLNVALLQCLDFTDGYALYYFVGLIVQLYLIFPLLLMAMPLKAVHAPLFFGLCLFPFLLTGIFNWMDIHNGPHVVTVTNYLPHFFLGMLVAESAMQDGRLCKALFSPTIQVIALVIVVGLIYVISNWSPYNKAFELLMSFAIFFSIPLLFAVLQGDRPLRLIRWISYGAYVFYLTHVLLMRIVIVLIQRTGIYYLFNGLVDPAYFTFIIFIGILSIGMVFSFAIQKIYDAIITQFTIASSALPKTGG